MKKRIITENIPNYGSSIIRTWETSNNFNQYDDSTKYIKSIENIPNGLLDEFPEKLANYPFIITNTGLTCFYDDKEIPSKLIIYDMFDTSNIDLVNIKPDISMMLQYNFIDQPLNVRKVNFKDNKFLPDLKYKYNNNWYYYLNCDGLEINNNLITTINDNSYFKIGDPEPCITGVYFDYKPIFVFKVYNSNGGEITNAQIEINGNNTIVKPYQDNIYIADLSALKEEDNNNPDKIKISIAGTGFMEVI